MAIASTQRRSRLLIGTRAACGPLPLDGDVGLDARDDFHVEVAAVLDLVETSVRRNDSGARA